ncbi:Signal peptidase i, partial [Globisporangium splendens]
MATKHSLARNAVLVFGWATVLKENAFDVIYGMGQSMEPVIPDGSIILVDRLSRRWRDWERGDVVLLRSPTRSNGATICKRILALVMAEPTREGDVVHLHPRYDESRAETITVPKGHVWVEGDNPRVSVDSRQIGAVPAALVLGRARAITWPAERMSLIR